MTRTISAADRVGAAAGAAYILLINVGNQMSSGNSQDPHPSGVKDLADLGGQPTVVERVGFVMELAGFVAFMFFLGWLVSTLRARGGAWGWLAGVAGVSGVTTVAIKLGSIAPILAGGIDHDQLSPTLARVLADMNGSSFVVTFLPFGVFVLAAGGAMLATGLTGRLLGRSGVVIGALGIASPLAWQLDPVNTNFLPFLFGMLWTLCVGVRLAVWGPKHPQATEADPSGSPVPSVAAAV